MKQTRRFGLLVVLFVSAVTLGVPVSSVFADTTVSGVAVSCAGGIASCTFTLSDGSGNTGTAATSAFVGGYVGQSPLPFSGGSVSFLLPGETLTSSAVGTYSGEAVLDGYSSTAGTLYLTTGSFVATDVNTGLVVTGTTSTIVGISGHSGRGGGNVYTLVSGTISMTSITTPRATTTTLSCGPTPTPVNAPVTCTVSVTDTNATTPVAPSGSVTFASSGSGSFSSAACALAGIGATSTCSVTYTPNPGSEGTHTITASYPGDTIHLVSSASASVTAIKRTAAAYLYCASPYTKGKPTTCTVTVTDISPGTPLSPSGIVKFSANHRGRFLPASCSPQENNDVTTCSVSFTPARIATYTVTAAYGGDTNFAAITATQTFKVG